MNEIDGERLEAFVVWGPMLGKETRPDAVEATAYFNDPRTTHFWTPEHRLAERFSTPVGLPAEEPAWDTFLLYAPGVRWGEEPPPPTFAMHVGKPLPDELKLDGRVLAQRARSLLAAAADDDEDDERPGRR